MNAIFYVLRGSIAWRLLTESILSWDTVYGWFTRLRDDGTWETLNQNLVMLDREQAGRQASPTAAMIYSQSVKTIESGGVRGLDGGKKIKRRRCHAMVDTAGRALKMHVHAADIQDRDGIGSLVDASRNRWPFVSLCDADVGYQGPQAAAARPIRLEIVRNLDGQVEFAVHARRWVVERFFVWINRNQTFARDFEATIGSTEAFTYAASAVLPLRRFAR